MPNSKPTLFIFSGLPGSGKSTLASQLAAARGALYLRIDTIEQALRDLCNLSVQGEGYRLAYKVASDNLSLGLDVVADSCNPIQLTRAEWETVAAHAHARAINIEIICSDPQEHRRRVETRSSTGPGQALPTWAEVQNREYHPWMKSRLIIDTANTTIKDSFQELTSKLIC
jgi:predicted kinase